MLRHTLMSLQDEMCGTVGRGKAQTWETSTKHCFLT